MPPRTVKKTPPGPGARRGGRGGRSTTRSKNKVQPEIEEPVKLDEPAMVEEPVKVEEPVAVDVRDEKIKVEEQEKATIPPTLQEKVADDFEPEEEVNPVAEVKSNDKEVISLKKDEVVKESVDEYEKDERLDLDDNDPEYEPEEYVGVDYDEKEIEQEDMQEVEDPVECGVGEEEDGDMVEEEEIEEVQEKLEGEGDDDVEGENVEEEQGRMVDHTEEEEHHEIAIERCKRKEFEIFVGGLDKDASEDDLRKVFSVVGEVTEIRLMMNPQTKKNKGFAFLRFATVEQAKRACSELKNPVVRGKQCGVTPSQDSDTLFLGNICRTWTKEALRERLKHYGVDNIEDLTLVEDSNSEGTNRGFAFLEFSSHSDAMDAFKRLQKRDVVFGVDRPAKVSFADSFIDPGDEIMAQVKTVFVDGLSASWDEDGIRQLLKTYGEIEKVELARNMPSAKRKDFGFVTFATHDAAVICAKSINNEELGEGDSKVKVRARLSRPLQRSQGKHVSHGELRYGRALIRNARGPWNRPLPRAVPFHGARSIPARLPPVVGRGFERPASLRDRRQVIAVPPRPRPVAPPQRSYDRRLPVPPYPKSSLKRDYVRREEVPPPRSRAVAEYSRVPSDRRMPYRDEYSSRGSGYPDLPRGPPRPAGRRDYVDDSYGPRHDGPPPPAYHEERGRDYDTLSGSKRPYAALDDVPPRYAETGVRQSRARLEYEHGNVSQYGDVYGDRLGRSNLGYGGNRSSISSQDSHGLYSSRQGMGYGGGSYSGSDLSGMYSSGYGSDYTSRGGDVGGSSYSSFYSGRGLGGSSYMGSGSSGSYY